MSILTRSHNRARATLVLAIVGLLMFACAAEPAHAPAPVFQQDSGDTLHSSPWVQQTLQLWPELFASDSLAEPRVFCVTTYAQWPHYFYIKSLKPTAGPNQCEGAQPLFMQAATCPRGEITLSRASRAPWIVVQCGPDVFQRYNGRGIQPQTDGGRAA